MTNQVVVTRLEVLEILVLAFGSVMEIGEAGLSQFEQGFSSFFAKSLAYLMIFQSGACQVY